MNFSWSEEQLALKKKMVEFAQGELNANLEERDRCSDFSRENWLKCCEAGILGLFVPAEYGGLAKDIPTTILAMEGIGYGCRDNGLTLALNGQMWAVQEPILAFGTVDQKKRFLPPLCTGDCIGAHGMTEPDSGSDTFSLKTTAIRSDGGYILNGSKSLIGMAPVCDLVIVFATTNADLGRWGQTAFILQRGTAGFTVSANREKMGLRTVPFGELSFENCFIPEENRLGPEGGALSLFSGTMEWERSFIFASHVGAMARQLDEAVSYARKRKQFGKSIGKFQSVSNRIANMKLRLETAKLLLYQAAWRKQQGKASALEAAMTKLHISEAFLQSSLDSIRIHGGNGYLSANGIERDLRDATGGVIYSGTSDIQRVVIAGMLGV